MNSQPRTTRGTRLALTVGAILIGGTTAFTIADALVAARVEHNISQTLFEGSNLPTPPDVHLAGYPYTWAAKSHELAAVSVTSRDITVPGIGMLSFHTSAQKITVPADVVYSGNIENAPAEKVFTRLQLDGVLIGNVNAIPDLQISNFEDISPRGGWETEATFRGTPEGFAKPITAHVSLRIREGDVYITPVDIELDAADSARPAAQQAATEAMTWHIQGANLPLSRPPVRVYVSGGSVFVESEQYFTTVSIEDLLPRTRPLSEAESPSL